MLGYKCPLCGSESLRVKMSAWVKLVQTLDREDGIDENETAVDTSDVEIEKADLVEVNGDTMACSECQHVGKMDGFEFKTPPLGTVGIANENDI